MIARALPALLAVTLAAASAEAQESFPARVTLLIGYEAGGGYDQYARFMAPYLAKHLPGHPTVVPQNMPGAGSLKAANYLYNVAPKDGSVIATIGQSVPQMQVFGQKGIQFEATRFGWIGRMADAVSMIGVWHTAPAQTIEEAKTKEVTIAVGGALSGSVLYVQFLNALVGTKLKPIEGYSSNLARLAMERGEVDGSSSLLWSVVEGEYRWVSEKKARILVQAGIDRIKEIADVPLIQELGRSEEDRTILRVVSSSDIIGRSLLAPPDLPPARLATLRRAFDAAISDPDARAQGARMKVDLNPLTGERLSEIVGDYDKLSPQVIEKIRQIAGIRPGD
jgi:tripartite-type tricarboxylate transporter receptor subunit TctC